MQNPENQTERMVFLGKYIYDRIIVEAQKTGKDPLEVAQEKKKNGEWDIKRYIDFSKYNRNIQEQAVIIKRQE
jgi:hypothetical protein